jgi:xanthine/uracil permease
MLVFGVGGMAFHLGEFSVEGIGLAGIAGVVLNLVLPRPTRRGTGLNDELRYPTHAARPRPARRG